MQTGRYVINYNIIKVYIRCNGLWNSKCYITTCTSVSVSSKIKHFPILIGGGGSLCGRESAQRGKRADIVRILHNTCFNIISCWGLQRLELYQEAVHLYALIYFGKSKIRIYRGGAIKIQRVSAVTVWISTWRIWISSGGAGSTSQTGVNRMRGSGTCSRLKILYVRQRGNRCARDKHIHRDPYTAVYRRTQRAHTELIVVTNIQVRESVSVSVHCAFRCPCRVSIGLVLHCPAGLAVASNPVDGHLIVIDRRHIDVWGNTYPNAVTIAAEFDITTVVGNGTGCSR